MDWDRLKTIYLCIILSFIVNCCINTTIVYHLNSHPNQCISSSCSCFTLSNTHISYRWLQHGSNIVQDDSNTSLKQTFVNDESEIGKEDILEEKQKQYIRYRFNKSGFANNIFGMVSAYVIATLINATLIFESNNQFQYVFRVTNVNGELIESPNIVRVAKPWVKQRYEYDCVDSNQKLSKLFMNNSLQTLFQDTLIDFYSNCPLFVWIAHNEEYYNRLITLGLLEAIPFSLHHPSIHGFHLLSSVLRNHITFTPMLTEYVAKNLGNHWDPSNRAGIHIRMGDLQSDLKETRVFLNESDIVQFLNCTILKTKNCSRLYLASDSKYAKQVFRSINRQFGYSFISSHQTAQHTSSYDALTEGPSEALFTSVADLISLAQTEVVVGTEFSSFSIVAAAFQGSEPYLVSKGGHCQQKKILNYNK